MKLYHFTALLHLSNICREGITKGEVPLDRNSMITGRMPSAPNLTGSGNGRLQEWTRGAAVDKTKVRISVDITDGDKALVSMRELWKRHGADRAFIRFMDPYGQSKFWYIYFGVIPPSMFASVEIWDGGKYFPVDDLPRLLADIDAEREKFDFVLDDRGALCGGLKPGISESWLLDNLQVVQRAA